MFRTALIIEDQPAGTGVPLAELLADRCEVVRTVGSAAEAAEVAIHLRPDLVITPFPAVTGNGELLTAFLKRNPRTSSCRVLAYSDWCWTRTRAKAREAGCEAFVAASAPVEDLLAALDELANGSMTVESDLAEAVRTGLFD